MSADESTRYEQQHTTFSTLKSGEKSDTLTFTLDLLLLRLVCICVIPEPDCKQAPVYVKFRLRPPFGETVRREG